MDTERATYCEARWKEGLSIARQYTSVVTVYINGVQGFPVSLAELDMYRAGWQNETHKLPEVAALASWNLLGVGPIPDAGPYSLMLDVVRNAPVPVADGNNVQLGREEIEAILDYAEHLAAFKQGGEEFMATGQQYNNVVNLAKARTQRTLEQVPFWDMLSAQESRQESMQPTNEKDDAAIQ